MDVRGKIKEGHSQRNGEKVWNCSTNELITTLTPNTNKQNEQNFISVDTAR